FSPDYARDGTLFSGGDAVYRSTDRGRSWAPVGLREVGAGVSLVALSPAFALDGTIFAVTAGLGLYKSTDGGGSWQYLGFKSAQSGPNVRGLVVSPSYATDHTLFLVSISDPVWGAPRLYKSTDGGESWQDVDPHSPRGTLNGILALSPSYGEDQTILAGTYSGWVFRSTDGGQSWTQPQPNGVHGSVQRLVFSPNYRNDGTLFLATSYTGVYRSKDKGDTWQPMSGGLTTGYIQDLAVGSPFTLFAAARARGIWEYRYQPGYEATFIDQSYPTRMRLGEERQAWVALRNTGDWTWQASGEHPVGLGTSEPRDRTSPFFRPGAWEAPNRPARLERDTPPGEVGVFSFLLRAPDAPGSYREFFRPVAEGVTWLNDLGIYFQITVTKELATSPGSLLFITPKP
ncbi:MAG: hypothetical protein Q8P59_03485, partial [Dehalococcoidia bacterium]|nr:hypothetical protein [Dehalococcoidia bacterium]